jgi:hypothetical protein
MSDTRKRRNSIAPVGVAIISLLIYASGFIVYNARTLASAILDDALLAAAFSIIPVVIGFPLLVATSYLVRWIAETAIRRSLPYREYALLLAPSVIGVVCLTVSVLQDRSPRKLLREFINTDAPPSVSNFEYWWRTLPGDSLYVLSFKVNPTEFNKLLANHSFVEDFDPEHIREALRGYFHANLD